VHEREIGIATADGDMVTFVVHPDGDGPWPVAVLFMDGAVGYSMGAKAALQSAERHFERTLDLWRRNLAVERLGA